jgi:hypothetical protein
MRPAFVKVMTFLALEYRVAGAKWSGISSSCSVPWQSRRSHVLSVMGEFVEFAKGGENEGTRASDKV